MTGLEPVMLGGKAEKIVVVDDCVWYLGRVVGGRGDEESDVMGDMEVGEGVEEWRCGGEWRLLTGSRGGIRGGISLHFTSLQEVEKARRDAGIATPGHVLCVGSDLSSQLQVVVPFVLCSSQNARTVSNDAVARSTDVVTEPDVDSDDRLPLPELGAAVEDGALATPTNP